jgi:hypothetical protein
MGATAAAPRVGCHQSEFSMAKHMPSSGVSDDVPLEIDLKDHRLAAFLAWLVPGLGHFYQGRTGKGVLFFVCILGTFVYGMMIGDGKVVYASSTNPLSRQFYQRWHYVCQLGVGLPALPALVQKARMDSGKPPLFGYDARFNLRPPLMAPNRQVPEFISEDNAKNRVIHPNELAMWNYDLADRFELGTVFTVIAGLLNILAIYDAFGGPLVIPPPEEKKKDV